jgi:hypothetical protein
MRERGFSRLAYPVERDLLACGRVVRSSSGTVALAAVDTATGSWTGRRKERFRLALCRTSSALHPRPSKRGCTSLTPIAP